MGRCLEAVSAYHTAYISIGSNLGDKLENCRSGIAALAGSGTSRLVDQAQIYRTEPVDYKDQDWFVNTVVKIQTRLDPIGLLENLQSIERKAGRIRDAKRFGPRILDLDILVYEDVVMNTPRLVIPHPRMHKRRFVLKPMCDIDPDMKHPVFQRSMRALLDNVDEAGQRMIELT